MAKFLVERELLLVSILPGPPEQEPHPAQRASKWWNTIQKSMSLNPRSVLKHALHLTPPSANKPISARRRADSIRYDIGHSPVDHRCKSKDPGDNQQPWKILIHRSMAFGFAR